MRWLEKCFYFYGIFVAKNPLPFLIIPCIVTLISSVGLLNFRSQDDIWDIYAPLNALSRLEEKALDNFEHLLSSSSYKIQIIIERKDGNGLFNAENIMEIASVNRLVVDNLTVVSQSTKKTYHYNQFSSNDSNAVVLNFLKAALENKENVRPEIVFTFPNARAMSKKMFLGYSIGQLKMSMSESGAVKVVDDFRLFVLHYMIDLHFTEGHFISEDFEIQLLHLFDRASAESPYLNYALLSRNREMTEQRKITIKAIPYLLLTGVLLTLFMLTTLSNRKYHKSQHIEAIFAIISPSMALVTTFGLIWSLGFPFSNILTVVPFLVITIGIDGRIGVYMLYLEIYFPFFLDAFLILAGWRHSNPTADLETRMGESLAKSGASVSVTSVTDVLCFIVGIFSNLPVVQLFCLYTSVALTLDFVYQVTFFVAISVYSGRNRIRFLEENDSHLQFPTNFPQKNTQCKSKLENSDANELYVEKLGAVFEFSAGCNNVTLTSNYTSQTDSRPSNTTDSCSLTINLSGKQMNTNCFIDIFVKFLFNSWVKSCILGVFAAHLVFSIYCCSLVNTDFDMENLYLRDSPLTPISKKMQNFVLKEAFVVNFVLNDMGSFSNPIRRQKFNLMIKELEQVAGFGFEDNATNLWTLDYQEMADFWSLDPNDMWEPVRLLHNYRAFKLDEKNIHTRLNKKKKEVIDSFTWQITYHNMKDFIDVEKLLQTRRQILSKYGEIFKVSSHHPLEKVPTESAASAPINFIQTAVSAIILMSVLVFFFIMNLEAILTVVLSILSISLGTVGYLHLLNINLDAVSLISMLLSIGFSVDYSAHICYHFYTFSSNKSKKSGATIAHRISTVSTQSQSIINSTWKECKVSDASDINSEHKVKKLLVHTFGEVGWPVIQSGLSTVLGMIPLLFVDAYVVAVFWKTIVLVTLLGM